MAQTPIGKKVEVAIIRGGKKLNKKVTIEELKEAKVYASAEAGSEEGLGMEVSTLTAAIGHLPNQEFEETLAWMLESPSRVT